MLDTIIRITVAGLLSVLLLISSSASRVTTQWALVHTADKSHALPVVDLVFLDGNHGWMLTPFELLETTDNGNTWAERLNSEAPKKAFYSLTFTSPTVGFIVGAQRKGEARATLILRTEDGGKNWDEISFGVSSQKAKAPLQLNSIRFVTRVGGRSVPA